MVVTFIRFKSELRKERISILLLLLRSDCCDYVTIPERLDKVEERSLIVIKYRFKNMTCSVLENGCMLVSVSL